MCCILYINLQLFFVLHGVSLLRVIFINELFLIFDKNKVLVSRVKISDYLCNYVHFRRHYEYCMMNID